ncbi:hypothetical protein Kpho02_26340 [Kitasatospora phosalacinea]|uniref:DUF4229 domain-containing protein n=1 Tax=Kitasatospora phosalacinea TaxID=2065 RepID=A0A9W6Q533_9ACTN|nr:DUF4229 domain-containing protein [Kitasatospora phosalacinea]GLW70335.1 hypothetical protein Kpho02_26340 [Kitasatospora phosalacinea]
MSSKNHATLRYTSLRASIFLACLLVALILGHFKVIPVVGSLGVLLLFALAAVASSAISYVALSKQRDEMSAQIAERIEARKSRAVTRDSAEDAADDAARAAAAQQAQAG